MDLGGSDITLSPFPIPFPVSLRSKDSDPSNHSHINRDQKKEGETQVSRERRQGVTRMLLTTPPPSVLSLPTAPANLGGHPFTGSHTVQVKECGFGIIWPWV